MTRVLVDLLFHSGNRGGMESYVQNLYAEFGGSELEFVALASKDLARAGAPWFPGAVIESRGIESRLAGGSRVSWVLGELSAVGTAARKIGADLIHSPANIGPWSAPVPIVLTVHDLLPFRRPDFVPGAYGPVLRTLVRRAASAAARIITISEQSAADIRDVLAPGAEIDVIPLAGGGAHPDAGSEREHDLLLALGNRMPHKNFIALLGAIAVIPESLRPRLVITGGGSNDPLTAEVARLGLGRWVELTGWLSTDQIETLYSRATAVVIPSLFEGFGLPILEGMARGCPVICSDLPVLREVAGDAAVYFDPMRTESIAATISRTLSDRARLADLATLGRARSARYSWARTAASTLESFQRALDA
jgi:glycosyltransferase involved in cell wall biosynthesis